MLPIKPGTARRLGIERPEEVPEPPVVLTGLVRTMLRVRENMMNLGKQAARSMSGLDVDREYWDMWGHLSTCPVWGDDQMVEQCTCGQADLPCRKPDSGCRGKKGAQRCGSCSVRWLRSSV